MGCAIAIVALNETAQPVEALWRRLARIEGCPDMGRAGYPPHLTLAICEDLAPAALANTFDAVLGAAPALSVRFDRIDAFADPPHVVWAAPADPGPLLDLHGRLHGAIDPASCHPHYRPGQWTPHLTLASYFPAELTGTVAAAARETFEPFTITFDRADLVGFPDLEAWQRHRLAIRA